MIRWTRPIAALLVTALSCAVMSWARAAEEPPRWLADTGLYRDPARGEIADDVLPFTPQYPLWSDGASKRRWIRLPAGSAIDARNPDAWVFPVGTRLWKEFRAGRVVETRMIDRLADGSWRFVSYAWQADGFAAELAPVRGTRVDDGRGGRYRIPSRADCRACHDGAAAPVLGFSALQLSPLRDPLAPHAEPAATDAAGLAALVRDGRLLGLPGELLQRAPRIDAPTPLARAALGYLHGNCGHCHDNIGDAGVPTGLLLSQRVADPAHNAVVRESLRTVSPRYRAAGADHGPRAELVLQRMRSRDPLARMPPLGTEQIDDDALALIQRWVHEQHTALAKEASHVPSHPEP